MHLPAPPETTAGRAVTRGNPGVCSSRATHTDTARRGRFAPGCYTVVTCPAGPLSAKIAPVACPSRNPGGTMHRAAPLLAGALLAGSLPAAAPPPSTDLPRRARAVLQAHCSACHGGGTRARAQGGFGYI